jgi:hypothetical protein
LVRRLDVRQAWFKTCCDEQPDHPEYEAHGVGPSVIGKLVKKITPLAK